jgi:hypothetical protein
LVFLFLIGLSTGIPDNRVVLADDVLATIKAGQPAEFDDCTVVGYLNLSVLTIERPVHFNHTTFQDFVVFESSIFNGDAYFESSTFNGYAGFISSTFNGYADFISSTFNGYADFRYSKLNGYAYFGGSAFNSDINFVGSTFNDGTDFTASTFNGGTYFRGLTFNGYVAFVGSAFNNDAYFESSTFNGYADFESSTFNRNANFVGSTFKYNANFEEDTFDKDANFDDVVFKGNAIFNRTQFKEGALFENTTFQSTLSLTKAKYDKLFIRWYKMERGLVYDDAAYMSLMKNFKDLGYFEDYDSCYFQYRKEHRGQSWPLVGGLDKPIRKSIDFFLEWFYGYGTRPINALYFSIAIIVAFGIFWRTIGVGGPDDVTEEDDKGWEKPGGIFDVLSLSTTIFLSGTKLFIDPPAIPKIRGRSRSIVKKAFIVERILGALFSILFFLAISGTVVR